MNFSKRFSIAAASALALLFIFILSGCKNTVTSKQAVVELTSSHPSASAQLIDLGAGKAAVFWLEESDLEHYSSRIDVIDVCNDKLLHSLRLPDSYIMYNKSYNGGLMLCSSDFLTYLLLDSELNTIKCITMPEGIYGEPNDDLSCFYYMKDGYLFRMNTSTGECARVPLQWDMRLSYIQECSASSDLLAVSVCTDEYESTYCSGIINWLTGEFVMLNDSLISPLYSGGYFAMNDYDEYTDSENTDYRFDYIWGSDSSEGLKLRSVSADELHRPAGWDNDFIFNDWSPYLIGNNWTWDDSTQNYTYRPYLHYLGDDVSFCNLERYGCTDPLGSYRYLPEKNLLLASSSYDCEEGKLFAVNLDAVEFTFGCEAHDVDFGQLVDSSIGERYLESRVIPQVSENIADLRARADGIENQYGITILMSNQCERMAAFSSYETELTCDYSTSAEREYISSSLDELERALALYPEGFFRQFRDCIGEAGINILLTGTLTGEANAVGLAYTYNSWYNIIMDVKYGIQVGTFCHEMWHCSENRLPPEAAEEFVDGSWEACNPEGFEYYLDYNQEHEDWEKYLYFYEYDPDNAHFADSYSKTFPGEDRARIMEYIMGSESLADDMMDSPALRRKMEILCRALRAGFNTDGWENVWWERYLAQ